MLTPCPPSISYLYYFGYLHTIIDCIYEAYHILNNLPPASRATAHGVDSGWNDDNDTTTTNNEQQQWWWMTMTMNDNNEWQRGRQDNEGRTMRTQGPPPQTVPPTATMGNCSWGGNGVQWGWGQREGTTPLSRCKRKWGRGFSFCSQWRQARYPPPPLLRTWEGGILIIYINLV